MRFKPPMTHDELTEKVPWSVNPVWMGCDIGRGWIKLVSDLIDDLNEMDCTYTVAQIKEKFGGLRFYYDPIEHAEDCDGENDWNDCPLSKRVAQAENESYTICEQCGGQAEVQDPDSVKFGRWGSYCERCR